MLTNDELDELVFRRGDSAINALVGELRAERTRTETLRAQRDELGQALGALLVAMGGVEDVPLTGPQLLLGAADAAYEWERQRTENLRTRVALEPIAARACENYTSGPGSCQRNGRLPVTDGPEFTGTADEICYPCFAWAALAASVEEPPAR